MPWLRLWVDVLDDPDLYELPEEACWGWVLMLGAAKRFDQGGDLPPLKTLAHWLRKPEDKIRKWITELTRAGLLESRKGTISVHGWDRWQGLQDRTNAARQAKFRANQKALRLFPPLESPSPKEIDRGEEKRNNALRNAVTAVTLTPVTALPAAAAAEFPSHADEDAADWRAAMEVLRSRPETAALADLIAASHDDRLPLIEGWQALVASHAVQKPGKKIPKTVAAWIRCADKANGADLEAIERPRQKPDPGSNGSLRPAAPRPVEAQPEEPPPGPIELRKRLKELKKIKKPNPWEVTEAQMIQEELAKR